MTRHRLFALPLLVVLLGAVVLAARGTGPQGEQYDLVLMGGRVLDPETGLDAKRNVGIRDGRIAAVTVEPLAARETLADAHVARSEEHTSELQSPDHLECSLLGEI